MPRPPRSFYQRDPVTLAKALLGQRLVRIVDGERVAGLIVETEAYLGVPDRAAHTFGGRRTARNESMWGEAGHAYVYFTYGMHYCMNVVAAGPGEPVAVLVRALEPAEGIERMRERRTKASRKASLNAARKAKRDEDLCSGPAKLCEALGIDRSLDGADLVDGEALFVEQVRRRTLASSRIVTASRIGVAYAGPWAEKPLRFYVKGNPHVSRT